MPRPCTTCRRCLVSTANSRRRKSDRILGTGPGACRTVSDLPKKKPGSPGFFFRLIRCGRMRGCTILFEALLESLVAAREQRVGGGHNQEREQRAEQHAADHDPADLLARLGAGAVGRGERE